MANQRTQLGLRVSDGAIKNLETVQGLIRKAVKESSGLDRPVSQSDAVERALQAFLDNRKK